MKNIFGYAIVALFTCAAAINYQTPVKFWIYALSAGLNVCFLFI